jgi:superfamily II DNA helicase RecQ
MVRQQQLLKTIITSSQHPVTVRGATQGLGITAFLQATRDVLLVAPTGQGKSILLLLAARELQTTVVIVPYAALRENTYLRGGQLREGWNLWSQLVATGEPQRNAYIHGVVILSTTEALSIEFKAWARTASHEQRLRRVVIDEVHVLLTESSFRRDVMALEWVRQLRAPLFLMTATLPPEDERTIKHALGIMDLVVIRGPPTRPNTRYQVRHL